MIKYKNNLGLGTESFITSMEKLDKEIRDRLAQIDFNIKGFDINVQEIIINTLYEPEGSFSSATEKQNVTIVYTLIKESKRKEI